MSSPYLTPAQEIHRIERIKAALKGKPATESQRKARADGLRKAWSEGRIKPNWTPESIEKTASKLRGRSRPIEVVEKIRLANLGKKRSPQVVEAMRQRVIEGWAFGKYRLSPEKLIERGRKIAEARKGWIPSIEQRIKHSQKMKGYKWSPEVIESRAAPMRNRPQTAEATKAGPSNVHSLEGAIRDASGRIWKFRNLTDFVITHPELFDESDLIPEIRKGKPTRNCNASKRLLCLFGRGKNVLGTWKGWTAISETELGEDLLARNL